MKLTATTPVATAICIILTSCLAVASTMVIRLQDGTSVSYDTSQISSVSFADAPFSTQSGTPPLLMENFSSGLSTMWEPIQVAGGNFERFAAVTNGRLLVSVPIGNSWGKTGIMSRTPLFSVDATMADNPLKLTFEFDPSVTTGYVIALSPAKNPDVWTGQNIWFHWGRPTLIEGKAYMVNTQNNGDKGGESRTPSQAPKSVTLAVRPGGVEAVTSHGTRIQAQISWLKTGVPVYLHIFSHPWNQSEAASLALTSIRITQ
jgi:hypothetical protein